MYHQILKGKSFNYPMQVSSFQISVAHFSAKQLKVFSQAKCTGSIGKMAGLMMMYIGSVHIKGETAD